MTFFLIGKTQNVFYKTVDVKLALDSIYKILDSTSASYIVYSQSSYWNSRSDTSPTIQTYNSTLIISKVDSKKAQIRIVNPYFIYGPIEAYSTALDYFELNEENLFINSIRPDKRDLIKDCDTAYAIKNMIPIEWASMYYYEHYNSGTESIWHSIFLYSNSSEKHYSFDIQLFNSKNYYYKYNSALEIYPLYLLLQKEFLKNLDGIDYEQEMDRFGVLSEKDRLKYWLKLIPQRKAELKEMEKQLKKDLKDLDNQGPFLSKELPSK